MRVSFFASRLVTLQSSLRLFSSTSPSSSLFPKPYCLFLSIPDSQTCEEIGGLLSAMSEKPDCLFLDGDLGAGKTTFSRGFIRNKVGIDDSIRVTSPTYLLSNTYFYDEAGVKNEIRHMDLYRLSGDRKSDFDPLDFDYVFSNCISLIEWTERLPIEIVPSNRHRLDIGLSIIPSTDERRMLLTAPIGSAWVDRLKFLVQDGLVDDLLIGEPNSTMND